MLKIARNLVVVSVALVTAGCLQKETDHTLYLAPDGSVTWTATEARVFSDEKETSARTSEEQQYLSAARAGTHRIGLGLAVLGPDGHVRTLVVRDERPFTVVTEARFGSVALLLERLFFEAGLQVQVHAGSGPDEGAFEVTFDFGVETAERESAASVLLEEFDTLSFEMTDGEFVEADGFELSGGGRRATISRTWMSLAEAAWNAKGTIGFSLRWRAARGASGLGD
jgi:hypothetical protein